MLSLLYPISYLVSLSGLIGWFYVQENKRRSRLMSKLFLGGFFAYLLSLGMAEGELTYKLFVLFRDLIVLGLVSQFFSFFRKYKIAFFGMLFALYGLISFKGMAILQNTFPQKKATKTPLPSSTDTSALPLDANGELLIELAQGQDINQLKTLFDQYGITFQRAFQPKRADFTDLDDYFVLDIPNDNLTYLAEIEADLYQTGIIDWVEENEEINIEPISAKLPEPIKKQYGINDPGIEQLWGFSAMSVDQLYKSLVNAKIKPQKKATIAILDTGIDANHEDIAGNYKSIQKKYDRDAQGHGTHCAGIAGAVSNNALGVASFSRDNSFVQISSIQVLNSFGMGTQKSIINGMIEAADNQVDVISMSLGGRSNPLKQKAYKDVVKYANDAGTIVVVAAGNSNSNAANYAPANAEGVIAVSAIDESLNRATFSNYVTDISMGIAAPGVNIYSTFPNNDYKTFNGTSMATPYVAGLVGLMKSINPNLTTSEVYRILKDSGKDTKATHETGKLIQPAEAIMLTIE